jgi:hypothetical protein
MPGPEDFSEESISKLVLEYTLTKLDEGVIDWVLNHELDKAEKIEILLKLTDTRIKQILENLDIDKDFLKTL